MGSSLKGGRGYVQKGNERLSARHDKSRGIGKCTLFQFSKETYIQGNEKREGEICYIFTPLGSNKAKKKIFRSCTRIL